jgi:hypothetical protein
MPTARLITTISLLFASSIALAQVGANNGVLNPNLADKSDLRTTDRFEYWPRQRHWRRFIV